jgi:DNA-binding transcriptional regulator GbsR (MarR family)
MSLQAQEIRRSFALAWGRIGAAWGVAPSTASVQGYLLVHGGPLTEAELRSALGLSHRAALLALAECETWGLIERAPEPRRSGRRGPAATAWVPVGDHWEWFRRVAGARKERETDPVLPVIEDCRRRASEAANDRPGDEELAALRERLEVLTAFVAAFDAGVASVVRTDADALGRLFGVLSALDQQTLDRLLRLLASVPQDELARAARTLAGLRPSLARRLIGMAADRRLVGLLRSRANGPDRL